MRGTAPPTGFCALPVACCPGLAHRLLGGGHPRSTNPHPHTWQLGPLLLKPRPALPPGPQPNPRGSPPKPSSWRYWSPLARRASPTSRLVCVWPAQPIAHPPPPTFNPRLSLCVWGPSRVERCARLLPHPLTCRGRGRGPGQPQRPPKQLHLQQTVWFSHQVECSHGFLRAFGPLPIDRQCMRVRTPASGYTADSRVCRGASLAPLCVPMGVRSLPGPGCSGLAMAPHAPPSLCPDG